MTTTISNLELSAQINHNGAELFSLKNKKNEEFIWEGNPEYWAKHSPILFPIVGTLKNNTFSYLEQEYSLLRHGFARDMVFELIEKKDKSATFSLQSSETTFKMYPFEFELLISYVLENKSLKIQYEVRNLNNFKMPFSIGAHPAFALNNGFENYFIEFEQEEILEYNLLENDLISNKTKKLEITNKKIPLNYDLFANDALVFKFINSKSLVILNESKPKLKVHFEGFPNLGIWTKNNAPFICIEPWYGFSDTNENFGNIFEKEGIQILNPKEVFNSIFSIEIF